jgi:Tol biopolymer transport system component
MNSGGGTVVDVTGTDAAFVGSMDQGFNVYTSLASGNINRITNGIPIEITTSTHDFRPCVTPDGSKIAFVSTRDGNDEIYVTDSLGIVQTNVSNDPGSDTFPAISRDGTKIVFTSNRDGNNEIYIVDSGGTNLTRLTNDAGDDVTPAFTPDGTHVIFSSNRGGTYQIYQMDTAGANVTQVTTTVSDKFHASYKVDGSAIFFYTGTGVRQIVRCNPNGSGEVQLTSDTHGSDKTATWVY